MQQSWPPAPPRKNNTGLKVAIFAGLGCGGIVLVLIALAILGTIVGSPKATPTTAAAAPSSASPTPPPKTTAPAAKPSATKAAKSAQPAPAPANTNANIAGFSGPAADGHIFGRCLHSWWKSSASGITVHLEYPGPALVNVSLMTQSDATDYPSDGNKSVTLAIGEQGKTVQFQPYAHLDYVQIHAMSDRGAVTCDAEKGP